MGEMHILVANLQTREEACHVHPTGFGHAVAQEVKLGRAGATPKQKIQRMEAYRHPLIRVCAEARVGKRGATIC